MTRRQARRLRHFGRAVVSTVAVVGLGVMLGLAVVGLWIKP